MNPKILTALAALLVGSCAHSSKPVPLEKPIRTLGVASNCGSLISRESLAWLNVGADDHTTKGVSQWGMDADLPRQLEEATGGRIRTVPVEADTLNVLAWRGESMFGGKTEADMLRDAIRPPAQPVDAYLLYIIGADGHPTGQRVNVRYGMGIFSRINTKLAHVQCTAHLVDAATFKKLRVVKIGQIREVGSDLLLDRWDEYSPEQMSRVRAILGDLWRQGVHDLVARTPL